MQEVKEAIGIESRTTILNPAYIKEKMKRSKRADTRLRLPYEVWPAQKAVRL